MAEETVNALLAAARALEEVVAPALDAEQPLAVEQCRLVSQYLRFAAERVDLRYDLARFDLDHYLRMGAAVLERLAPLGCPAPDLESALGTGRGVLGRPGESPRDLEVATAALRTAVARLARTLDDEAARAAVAEVVLAASRTHLSVRRGWYLPQGWEPNPASVPPLDLRPGGLEDNDENEGSRR